MNIKNLKRAAEIQEQLPKLEEARKVLSQQGSFVTVHDGNRLTIELPRLMSYTIAAQINVEINKLKVEVTKL